MLKFLTDWIFLLLSVLRYINLTREGRDRNPKWVISFFNHTDTSLEKLSKNSFTPCTLYLLHSRYHWEIMWYVKILFFFLIFTIPLLYTVTETFL